MVAQAEVALKQDAARERQLRQCDVSTFGGDHESPDVALLALSIHTEIFIPPPCMVSWVRKAISDDS